VLRITRTSDEATSLSNPSRKLTASWPPSVTAPPTRTRSCSTPWSRPPSSTRSSADSSNRSCPVISIVPAGSPGASAPALSRLASTTPHPCSAPPWTSTLLAWKVPPARTMAPAVWVQPPVLTLSSLAAPAMVIVPVLVNAPPVVWNFAVDVDLAAVGDQPRPTGQRAGAPLVLNAVLVVVKDQVDVADLHHGPVVERHPDRLLEAGTGAERAVVLETAVLLAADAPAAGGLVQGVVGDRAAILEADPDRVPDRAVIRERAVLQPRLPRSAPDLRRRAFRDDDVALRDFFFSSRRRHTR